MTDKPALRASARATRDAFVATSPPPIGADERFTVRLSPGLVVATYVPLGSEADPLLLTTAALAAGCTLALPEVIDRATPLRFRVSDPGESLVPGPFGLRNPPAHAREVTPDIILTPLLAFDARLNRLGQGAGHYDRAFAAHPLAWRLGVAWSAQQLEALPADAWDVPLHAIITEDRWWTR